MLTDAQDKHPCEESTLKQLCLTGYATANDDDNSNANKVLYYASYNTEP